MVYEAYGPEGERVAIKVPRYDDPASRERLGKEAAAAQRVAAFCTARVVEVDLGVPYIVSEFVPGPTLRQVVAEAGPYTADALHRLAVGVATALTAIHEAGMVHRDLKPDNIILGPEGPRVIDFGVAREVGPTTTGPIMGTPNSMAPEVFAGRGATAAADLWAWALVVLHASSTGHPTCLRSRRTRYRWSWSGPPTGTPWHPRERRPDQAVGRGRTPVVGPALRRRHGRLGRERLDGLQQQRYLAGAAPFAVCA